MAQFQIGDQTKDIKLIVSTVAEAEHLSDFLMTCRKSQRSVNVCTAPPYFIATVHSEEYARFCTAFPYLLLKPKGWRSWARSLGMKA